MSTAIRAVRMPSYVVSIALLAIMDLALRFLGFARSVAISRFLAGRRGGTIQDRRQVLPIAERLARAAVVYPGRALCLEQSLALFVLLQRRGIAAELRLGVQPYPFNAHAWVELDGQPVNETWETIRQFVPMQEFVV